MNELVHPRRFETTRAADGLPRRRFSVGDVERMLQAGVLGEHDPFELIGGELVAMAAKGRQHEVLRTELQMYWARRCPPEIKVASETPLRLSENDEPEPDIMVYPSSLVAPDVRGDSVLLVVEIADSSLGIDLNTKAPMYASFGVREYWVINARTLVTTVHRDLSGGAYAFKGDVEGDKLLVPTAAPLAVRLADLSHG